MASAPPLAPHLGSTRRGVILSLVSVVALALVTFGGFAAGYVASGATPPTTVEAVVVGDDEPTPTPTPDATATPRPTSTSVAPPLPVPTVIRQFKSPSGNLRCSFEELSGVTSVTCQQELINYPFPSKACTTGAPGVFIAVNETGTFWPCTANSITPADTLALDVPTSENGITCSINYTTGVTCYNGSGHGFTMEYDRGVGVF